MTHSLRVALIGTAFMGRAHSQAWRNAHRFFPLPLEPELTLLVGSDRDRTRERAETLGWKESSSDWREAIARDDIDVIDISVPGNLHEEIALAALAAGKHVLCEKPLANDVPSAERMTDAAHAAAARGVRAMCGFSYRRTPALSYAKKLIDAGAVGRIRHVRAQYLQDWLADAATPMSWRLDASLAGSGALGDIGAHSIDTAQWLTGARIDSVSAVMRTFIDARPVAEAQGELGGVAATDAPLAAVTVDDAAAFTARFSDGALGVFEATRFATGRRNANRIEINGELGSIAFDFERMNELEYFDAREPRASQGFRRIQTTDASHPYAGNWWPVGHGLGYDHLFTNQVADFVAAIAAGQDPHPGFDEALDVQRVLEAVAASAAASSTSTTVNRSTNR